MRSPRRRLLLLAGAFALVALAGVVVYQTAPPPAFGWFAYSPLPEEVSVSNPPRLSSRQLLGITLATLGLIGASGTLGYLRGRRAAGRARAGL